MEMDYAAATQKYDLDCNGTPRTNLADWRYVLQVHSNKYVDASAKDQHGLAHFINHNHRRLCNCRFTSKGTVVSTKKIHPGDELFLHYGEDFTAFLKDRGVKLLTEAQYLTVRDKLRMEALRPLRHHGGDSHSLSAAYISPSPATAAPTPPFPSQP